MSSWERVSRSLTNANAELRALLEQMERPDWPYQPVARQQAVQRRAAELAREIEHLIALLGRIAPQSVDPNDASSS